MYNIILYKHYTVQTLYCTNILLYKHYTVQTLYCLQHRPTFFKAGNYLNLDVYGVPTLATALLTSCNVAAASAATADRDESARRTRRPDRGSGTELRTLLGLKCAAKANINRMIDFKFPWTISKKIREQKLHYWTNGLIYFIATVNTRSIILKQKKN